MKLPNNLGTLTYCLNIHPTQTWEEARTALSGPVKAVKSALSPNQPFAAGLRFSAETAQDLLDPEKRADLFRLLKDNDLEPITMNGFPYGPFHGTRVKEQVYLPDWRSQERVSYTNLLADLLSELNPAGTFISLSTVPCAFRGEAEGTETKLVTNYLRVVAHLIALEEKTGCVIALAIEPEPYCYLETIEATVAFFQTHLFGNSAVEQLATITGRSKEQARQLLPRHLGLCYDVCHAAVEFEDPAESIKALKDAGIPVHKLQLSSALRVRSGSDEARAALSRFDEPTYLHQLISRGPDGTLTRYPDLGPALGKGGAKDGEEWRVHFHVPVFLESLPEFDTTQAFLRDILAIHKRDPISQHLEIETYTWDVLPNDLVAGSVDAAIIREMQWVRDELGL